MGAGVAEMFICPVCDALIGVPVHPVKGTLPGPGDTVLCDHCGHLLVVGQDRALHPPTPEEVIEMASDEKYLAGLRAAEQAIHAPGSKEVHYHTWKENLRKIEE